jgi:hypothetical protein
MGRTNKTPGFPDRDRRLTADSLATVGMFGTCPAPVAAACLAFDQIHADGWFSHGGWASYADASMRRGWMQDRQHKGTVLVLSLLSVLQGTVGHIDSQARDGGWLNLVVLPGKAEDGSTIEIRGDLDEEMHTSVRSVVRGLVITVVRVWDPTLP